MGCTTGVVIFNRAMPVLLAIFLTAKIQPVSEITKEKRKYFKIIVWPLHNILFPKYSKCVSNIQTPFYVLIVLPKQ